MNLSTKICNRLPWALAFLRFILFVSLSAIGLCFYHTPFSSSFSIIPICTIVFLSDVFDGVFARRYLQPEMLRKFRYVDSIVDKAGLPIALLGFYASGRLPAIAFWLLIFRELALLLGGIYSVTCGYSIRGDNLGRIYYCVLFLMVIMIYPSDAPVISPIVSNLFFLILALLAFANFCSHASDRVKYPYKLNI